MKITVSGVEIHYEQYGAGEEILCLHGWGCAVKHFEPIAKELGKTHHVTVIDFPAHGESSCPPEPWGVTEFGECTHKLIEALKLGRVDIIAHSFGGRVALYLGAHYPEDVKRLVLTGCAGLKKPQTEEGKKRAEQYQKLKKLYSTVKKIPFMKGAAEDAMKALQQKYGSADYNALDDEMKKTFVKVVNEDLSPLLPQIQASTLLVFGENDTDTPLWMGQRMEKEIPDAGLVVFENDDHFAYLRQWPRFCAIVQAFLK